MSYDGKCEHGVWTHPFEDWERCIRCLGEKKLNDGRRDILAGIGNLTSRRDSEKDAIAGSILANLCELTQHMRLDPVDGVWRMGSDVVDGKVLWQDIVWLTEKYRRL